MSNVKRNRETQGYTKELSQCKNCDHFRFVIEKYDNGYEEKKQKRCNIGNFAVMENATCKMWDKKQ